MTKWTGKRTKSRRRLGKRTFAAVEHVSTTTVMTATGTGPFVLPRKAAKKRRSTSKSRMMQHKPMPTPSTSKTRASSSLLNSLLMLTASLDQHKMHYSGTVCKQPQIVGICIGSSVHIQCVKCKHMLHAQGLWSNPSTPARLNASVTSSSNALSSTLSKVQQGNPHLCP